MKKITFILYLLIPFLGFSQALQNQAPWMKLNKNPNKSLTLEEISKPAEDYFKTIDKNKKGSGLKPFERWKYHWSFYTKKDGTITPASSLWEAWETKNKMNTTMTTTDDSNWESLGPYSYTNTASWSPGKGRVNTFIVDPNNSNTYYIGAPAGGIWKSTDAGVNWTPLTDYLPQIGVSAIAIDPSNSNIIYIATGDDDGGNSFSVGVWKSTDGGTTWNRTGALIGNPTSMSDIYIFPNSPNTLLLATNRGIYKSTDGGGNWSRKLNNINMKDLKMKPNDSSTWYAVSRNGFYKSTNHGETFSNIFVHNNLSNSSRLAIEVTPANPAILYMLSSNTSNDFNGIYKSRNSGVTFIKTAETADIFVSKQSWFDMALTVSDTNENIVYVGVLNIWKSINGGGNFSRMNSWSAPKEDSYTHGDIHFMRFFNGNFFAGTDGGIYRSENLGTNFTNLTRNLAIGQFYKISVSQKNSENIVGGLQDNGGYAYNNNKWNNYHGADGMDCTVSGNEQNTYYGFTQYGTLLYKTNNGGVTINKIINAPSNEVSAGDTGGRWVTPIASNNSGEIYAGYSQLYKLVNNNWSKISNHSFCGDLFNIEIDNNDNNNIYVSRLGSLFRSTDKGVNFTNISTLGETINGIEISNNDSNIAWVVTNLGVYKSTNILSSSPTFTNITNNLPLDSKLVIKHHNKSGKNTVYIGTTLGVYYLNDDSPNWTPFDNNLPNVAIKDLEINEYDAKIFAATYGRGIFSSDIPQILPTNGIRLLSISSPVLICNENTAQITIKNLGTNTINSVSINYTIDGVNNNFTWNGTLNSEATTTISIPLTNVDYLEKHNLNITASILNDAYSSNNSETSYFTINNSSISPITINSFENPTDALLVETTNATFWELGTPNKNSLTTTGKAYVTKLTGNYPNNTIGYLYTNCYNLSTITNPILKFQMGFDIGTNWDYMVVEYSTDGTSWSILGNASDPNWYNSSATIDIFNRSTLPGKQWTGFGGNANVLGNTNATLHEYSYDLASFTNEPNITFRFKFFTSTFINAEGVLIDDLVIEGTLSTDDETIQNTFSIYPNPSSDGIFNLIWDSHKNATINVYNYLGKLIVEKKNVVNKFSVNLKNKSAGLYFVKITIDGKQATKKIILK